MIFESNPPETTGLRGAVAFSYLADESSCVEALIGVATADAATAERIAMRARKLVERVRQRVRRQGGLDAFLREYGLSSQEGVVLMCLAEALLRIPDADTADRLIREKLAQADWESHLGSSASLFVNVATWGLMLTGRIVRLDRNTVHDVAGVVGRLAAHSGEPLIRAALREAMRILGHQFVVGRTIEEALGRSDAASKAGYRHSFDMLGEAALTAADADRYYRAYCHAISSVAAAPHPANVFAAPGISVKLSALHPRFEFAQRGRVLAELVPRVAALAGHAKAAGLSMTLDAEEADRLDVTLDVLEAVFRDPRLHGWEGLGVAVQAYLKRGLPVVDWLADLARREGRRIMVRLVKGAYWDSEIKHAQERGWPDYPVFTRKANTDVSYLACARRVLAAADAFYPQFATHNAYTAAAVLELATGQQFEFQRLYGMGEALYSEIAEQVERAPPCRIYAPVGGHADLLPYLVRRLLENGANTSFINRIEDERAPIEQLIADPIERVRSSACKRHPRIPLPDDLFGPQRRNSRGVNLFDPLALSALARSLETAARKEWRAAPLVAGVECGGPGREIRSPTDRRAVVGEVVEAETSDVARTLQIAVEAAQKWEATSVETRARAADRAADLMEAHDAELIWLCVREGGRCIPDAVAEVREAVDYCRYYAELARTTFAEQALPGPTGERNTLALHGRGIFACISPWNFPLAIFTGQVIAALLAGNAVVAKPARQTPLVAMRAIQLLHEAGIPDDALHLLPGSSGVIGDALISDPRIAGVAVTGSTDTARAINRRLAERPGPIVPLIAETGGQNCMIVDSSALPEQVAADTLRSAFNSAGQRCSALRVLFLQEEIAPRVIALLQGAMAELRVGEPALIATDVGPVIDDSAKQVLLAHGARMKREGVLIYEVPLPSETDAGSFVGPMAFEIDRIAQLRQEVFGPMLHVIRFASSKLGAVIEAINGTGYGLTLGIHSRIEATERYVRERARVGNICVNRNMIGAVVGTQPFGGEGLSGTGPKAGGPHYLQRFAVERSLAVNTTALGGNAGLLALDEE